MATNWVDEVKSGATSTGSKALSLATGSALSVSNTTSENLFTVTADASNGGYTSILGIENQESILFLGADNADDAADVWQIQADTSGNLKIGNRTSGTGAPTRSNTITDVLTIDTNRNISVGVDDTGYDVKFFGDTSGKYMEWDTSADQLDVTGSFDVTGNSSMVGTLTVGVDDTGHDVKFFGATSGSYLLWDESDDALELTDSTPIKIGDGGDMQIYHNGSHSFITNSTGTMKLATENSGIAVSIGHTTLETTVNDNLNVTGDTVMTGDLTVNGNDINFGSGGKITDGNGYLVLEDSGGAGFHVVIKSQAADQDSKISLFESTTCKWNFGNDGDDSDTFKISTDVGGALETNTKLKLTSGGALSIGGTFISDGEIIGKSTMTTDTTVGANTWSAAELIGGMLLRDPAGGDRSDVTPTATQIVNAISNCAIGSSFRFHIRNTADANETITLTAGTGVTLSGTMTIAENYAKDFLAIVTNVGSPAVTIHSLGTYVW